LHWLSLALKAGFEDFQKTLEETGSIFEALKVGVAKTIGVLLGLPIEFILKAVGFIAGLFGFEDLKEKLNALNPIQDIADKIKLLFDEIQHIFTVLPLKLGEALSNIATNAIEAIKAILPSMEDLKAMLPSFDGLKNFFGFGGDEPEGKSKGGPIKAGVPYLVGEKGPELIVPGAASMVFPTEKTADIRTQQINQAGVARSGGGGGTVVVDAKSTNVVNSNSSSSATFTSTSLQHPNPLIKTLNYAF
jgi:SLT domain-containing protein